MEWTAIVVQFIVGGSAIAVAWVGAHRAGEARKELAGNGTGESVLSRLKDLRENQRGLAARMERVEQQGIRSEEADSRMGVRLEAMTGWQMAHEVGHERDRAYWVATRELNPKEKP